MAIKAATQTNPKLHIIWASPGALKSYASNAKVHKPQQIKLLAASIRDYKFINPIIVDKDKTVIAGHGRLEAAKLLGIEEVPTICAEHLSPEQVKAYRIADNRLAELAEWDERLLAIELKHISIETPELIISTGFTMGETDLLIEDLDMQSEGLGNANEPDPADTLPDMADAVAISQAGDLWLLGEHRVYCGNALEPASFAELLNGEKADMIFTDPPYNVPIDGHVSGKGKNRHREFAMASGEMSTTEYTGFLTTNFSLLVNASRDGALHYLCIDWRHMGELTSAAVTQYSELKNLCVWSKASGGMGSHYRSKHELIFLYKNGTAAHINNVQLGRYGRNRTNVWEYAGVNSFGKGRDEALAMHPTVKPTAMVKDAILDSSNRGDIILDPFLGSGTTLIAAHQSGRRGYGIELDPLYVDTIIRRWEKLTGKTAVHAETGASFEDMSRERLSYTEGGDDV